MLLPLLLCLCIDLASGQDYYGDPVAGKCSCKINTCFVTCFHKMLVNRTGREKLNKKDVFSLPVVDKLNRENLKPHCQIKYDYT